MIAYIYSMCLQLLYHRKRLLIYGERAEGRGLKGWARLSLSSFGRCIEVGYRL